MIQYIQCIKSKDEVSIPEFRRLFRDYTERMRVIAREVGATKVESSTTLAVEANLQVMQDRGTQLPYDGVLEVYFPNATLLPKLDEPELAAKLDELQAFQDSFVDLERSTFFFATVDEG